MPINNKNKPKNYMNMKVQSQKRHQDREKSKRDKQTAENY